MAAPEETPACPPARQAVTGSLVVHDAKEALAFYEHALGATVVLKIPVEGDHKNRLMHSLVVLPGGGQVMIQDDFPDWCDGQLRSALALGGTPVKNNLLISSPEELDELVARAKNAGMEVVSPPGDMFWGDRHAELQDKYGHRWSLVSELPEDRKAAVASQVPKGGACDDAAAPPPAKKARSCRATLHSSRTIAAAPQKVYQTWVSRHRELHCLPPNSTISYESDVKYEVGAVVKSRVQAADGSLMCSFEECVVDMQEGTQIAWQVVCKTPDGKPLSSSIQTLEFLPDGESSSDTKVVLTEQVTWLQAPLLFEHKASLDHHLDNLAKAVLP